MKKFILLLPLCFTCVGLLSAQQIDITAQEIASEAQFAQPFDVHVELAHTPGYQVEIDPQSLPADFALLTEKKEDLSPGTVSFDLTFLPVNLGVSTFTAVNFILQDTNKNILAKAQTQEKPVEIAEVEFFKDPNLRDIRPPYIPANWFLWFLCALVALLIIYFIYHFWRSTRKDVPAEQAVQDLRPADVIALDKIHLLLQSGLWENAHYKLFYTELENIFREYVYRRFQLDVSSDTSSELLRHIRKIPQLVPLQTEIRNYLNSSDLVKFAKVVPEEPTMQQDICCVKTVVQATAPRPTQTQTDKQEAQQ